MGGGFLAINEVLSALADETRRKILQKLREGKINSGELAAAVGLSPQALSYHLAKMKKAGLIYETKEKNFIFYELDLTVLDEAIVWISTLKGEKNDER
ncbi:MAG: winged helix-turn-helix transcriptional regulator [Oscillospiraceae bacterium]|nr:winged helix-turn-helix transcriptional regulator [Oscillospiraceae bacterium]